jgi:hypothetical protein
VSLDRLRGLIGDAQRQLADAQAQPDPVLRSKLRTAAKGLLVQADKLAANTKPHIVHPVNGHAQVVGVGPDGHLDLDADGMFLTALIDDVEPAP